ncbi:hypothetical protein ABHN03_03820 [Paenibacillus sp. NRS-1775]|uniref:hypothetical protein n=1 Tax=unclassified Paenibacillus TaxID=185978 RepID=UPI003D2DBC26
MDKKLYKYTKQLIKQSFPKYKRIQVGATLTEVLVERGSGYLKLPLTKFKTVYTSWSCFTTDRHQVYVAIDQLTNKMYWNFEQL